MMNGFLNYFQRITKINTSPLWPNIHTAKQTDLVDKAFGSKARDTEFEFLRPAVTVTNIDALMVLCANFTLTFLVKNKEKKICSISS